MRMIPREGYDVETTHSKVLARNCEKSNQRVSRVVFDDLLRQF